MNRTVHIFFLAIALCVAVVGCKPTTPSQYIQPDEMVNILVDYHRARAVAQTEGNYDEQSYRQALYFKAVLQKHEVSEELFDSSLVYYYIRADRFAPIYHRVLEQLEDQSVILGATEGEIGRYATLNASGDTANIWSERTSLLLMPIAPYHRVEFEVKGDTLFRPGDTFLVQFMADYMYQSGSKDGLFYMAIEYPDTVFVRQTRFTYSGLIQLRMDTKRKQSPKAVRGFFYLGGGNERSTIMRLLFVNNIQLIRFHQKDEQHAAKEENSIAPVAVATRAGDEPVGSRNTERKGDKLLPLSRRDSPNRMVERLDSVKKRQ